MAPHSIKPTYCSGSGLSELCKNHHGWQVHVVGSGEEHRSVYQKDCSAHRQPFLSGVRLQRSEFHITFCSAHPDRGTYKVLHRPLVAEPQMLTKEEALFEQRDAIRLPIPCSNPAKSLRRLTMTEWESHSRTGLSQVYFSLVAFSVPVGPAAGSGPFSYNPFSPVHFSTVYFLSWGLCRSIGIDLLSSIALLFAV